MTEAGSTQTDNVASPPKADEDLSWSEFFREMENDYNDQVKSGGGETGGPKPRPRKKKAPPRKKRKKKKKKTAGCFG